MQIRLTHKRELAQVMQIYNVAREIMRTHGNPHQWVDGYPSQTLIEAEIEAEHSWVCVDEDGEIVGTFCYIEGIDPTYLKIYDGRWLNDEPYGTVHRLATLGKRKGIAKACFEWCARQCANTRADTHRDNKAMQHILERMGFAYCGIIYLANGSERLAYQRINMEEQHIATTD